MAKKLYAMNKNKYLLEPELAHLCASLEKFGKDDIRNTTMLWVLLHTGGRATEILNLRPKDLNHHDGTVFIYGLKGSNDRELRIPPWLFDRLVSLADGANPIFNISYNRMRQIWEQYRPCKKTLHSLRHTYAIGLYLKEKDIRLLQVALGHRNITNTMVYVDYLFNKTQMRRAEMNFSSRVG